MEFLKKNLKINLYVIIIIIITCFLYKYLFL